MHTTTTDLRRSTFLVLGTLVLASCGTEAVRLRGVMPLNLNDAQESTPVNVRIYQLKDERRFLDTEFEDLWVRDKEVLQDDYVAPPVVATVLPGSEKDDPLTVELGSLSSDTKFIGVMALFGRKWTGQERRRAVHVQDSDGVVFELRGYGLVLDVEKEMVELEPTTPVDIRIFQLERETAFLEASAEDLAARGREILEEDLRGEPVAVKTPPVGERGLPPVIEVGPIHPTTRNLGALALFENRGRPESRRVVIKLSEKNEYTWALCGHPILIRVPRKGE